MASSNSSQAYFTGFDFQKAERNLFPLTVLSVTNVVRTCGPTHLLVFDFISNTICLIKLVICCFQNGSFSKKHVFFSRF